MEIDLDALSDDALTMIREALDTGKFTTRMTGEQIELDPRQWPRLLMFLAQRKRTAYKPMAAMTDYKLPETH